MFKKICTTHEVSPGQIKTFEAAGRRVVIANIDGSFFAIDDTCTHELCSLGGGELDDGAVLCPCHGSRFDVKTGRVLSLPAVLDVASYPLKTEGDDVLIDL